jgi:hypothetical protein
MLGCVRHLERSAKLVTLESLSLIRTVSPREALASVETHAARHHYLHNSATRENSEFVSLLSAVCAASPSLTPAS